MYHISDIKKFLRCERLYYYSKNTNANFIPYLRSDENIINLIKSYFDIEDCFEGVRNDPEDRFKDNLDNYEWFIHPRFNDGELRINIPLVHKVNDGLDLYFIYYGTVIKELDTLTYKVSLDLLRSHGYKVNEIYLVLFNEDYINDGTLNPKELFLCVNTFRNERIIETVLKNNTDYKSIISNMDNYRLTDSKKNKYCRVNGLCEYYHICFPDEKKLPDDSILTLVSSRYKNKMYEDDIEYLKDADISLVEGNRIQYAQIMASKNNGLFIDKYPLKKWLSNLEERPISFIDFEWDRYLVPPYKNMKPMDVLCFEFALYYLDESGTLQHRTFLGTGDCRKEFIEALIEYLPSSGPILAYNAKGAECLRIEELGNMFPEYKERLDEINKRFIDLFTPFNEGLVYDIRMQGDFTLKKLVDICSKYSYADLNIDDGLKAVIQWRTVDNGEIDNEQEVLENLKRYCSLDAYGLFLVYKWLVELIIESK